MGCLVSYALMLFARACIISTTEALPPLVEGTLAAVVAASSGASLEKVIEEASNSLYPKKIQLGENFVQPKSDINAPAKIHGASWQ